MSRVYEALLSFLASNGNTQRQGEKPDIIERGARQDDLSKEDNTRQTLHEDVYGVALVFTHKQWHKYLCKE